MSRYWTDEELAKLRCAFDEWCGMPWDESVARASSAGTVVVLDVMPETWGRIAHHVATRTAKQCANRLQTELTWAGRRPPGPAAPDPGPLFARPGLLVTKPGRLAGIDVSPYIGQASGRIVMSFNGSGEP